MESGAYGAAKAGGSFDLRRFLAQPQVVARAVSLVFALIVFSCIFGEGYSNTHESNQRYCVFNRRRRLPLRQRHRRAGLPGLRLLLRGRRLLPPDQQRRGPQVPGHRRPALLSSLDLPVVRGFLLPYQPVGSHQPEGCAAGSGLSPSGHHLQLFFHLLLGPAGRPGLPALQGRGGRLYAELCGPHPRPQHSLRLLPGPASGQLPAASFHSERRGHRGLPASRCVLSRRRGW